MLVTLFLPKWRALSAIAKPKALRLFKSVVLLYELKHALNIMTPRELAALFKHHNSRSWNRFILQAGRIKAPRVQNVFDLLRVQLESFKILRIQ